MIKKTNEEKRIVYGEVYVPMEVDTDGEAMTADQIEKLAHDFMLRSQKIDIGHDEIAREIAVVESFMARENDPEFTPKAWVMGAKIFSDSVWDRVISKELTAFSFSAYAVKHYFKALVDEKTNKIVELVKDLGYDKPTQVAA